MLEVRLNGKTECRVSLVVLLFADMFLSTNANINLSTIRVRDSEYAYFNIISNTHALVYKALHCTTSYLRMPDGRLPTCVCHWTPTTDADNCVRRTRA